MATETHIPESVHLKIGDNALSSEVLEEKLTEPVGEKVMHAESMSQAVETVNTQVEGSIPTNESGTFLQVGSVPGVTSMSPSKEEALNPLEQNQDEIYEDIKGKTLGEYETGVTDIKEADLKEYLKEETEDKSAAQQAIEQREIVIKTEGKETGEISPNVEIEEKMDAITTDACTSTQTKSQVEYKEYQKKYEEEADIPAIKNVREENSSDKIEYENSGIKLNEKETEAVNKNGDEKREQEVNMMEKDEGEDVFTDAQEASFEVNECGVVTSKENIEGNTEEIISSVATTDVFISTQTKPEEETIKSKEKNEETIESDNGQTKKSVCFSTQAEHEKETIDNEHKNDEKATVKEVCEETVPEKAESEVGLHYSDSVTLNEKEDLNSLEKEKGDSDGVNSAQDTTCEDTKEPTPSQYKTTVANIKEQDPNEFIKEETEDKSTDAQQASKGRENEENDKTEPKHEESVKHEDQENEQDVNILEKDQGKDDFISSQDVLVEGDLQEKNHHSEEVEREFVEERESIEEDTQEIKSSTEAPEQMKQQTLINVLPTDVCESSETGPDETLKTQEKNDEEAIQNDDSQTKKSGIPMVKEICEETVLEKDEKAEDEEYLVSKDEDQEKVQELYVSENDQSGGNDVTSSQNASNEDVKETTIGHVTTAADLGEELEEKVIDTQKASEKYEDSANDNRKHNPEDSVKDIVHSVSKVDDEEYTKEVKPSVENEDKDDCISTPTEFQEEPTKNEEKTIEGDDDLKEESGKPFVKEVCEETDVKKAESEEVLKLYDSSKMNLDEKAIEIISKDEDYEDEIVQIGENMKGDDEDLKTSVKSEEITEQQRSVYASTLDVNVLTQKESHEDTTQNEEKNEEPMKEASEETSLEKVESEEGLELHDSLNTKINEKTVIFKDEDQEVNIPEDGQGKDNVTSSHDAISKEEEEVLQQKNYLNESNEPEFVETRDNVDKEIKSSVEEKENPEQHGFSYITTNDDYSSTQAKEETVVNEAKLDAEKQVHRTEDKSEMEDEVVSTSKISLEEQNVEEVEAGPAKATEDEVTKKDSSHINIQDINEGITKEEKYFQDESRDIEVFTLEHEPTEKQNSVLNDVSKENASDLNETTSVEPQDSPPSSLEPSPKDTSDLDKEKPESEILPVEDLESVTEIQIPEVVPNLEDSKLISGTGTHLDEEKETVTEENSADEQTEQQTEISKETLEEVSDQCGIGKKNKIEEKPTDIVEDDFLSSENASLEDIKESTHGQHATPVAIFEEDKSENAITEEIFREKAQDNPINTQEMQKTEQTTEIKQETLEGTSSENAGCEGFKLSNSSSLEINEKEITSNDEDQEKSQEVNLPEEGLGKDAVTRSQDTDFEEKDLQEKNCENKDNEYEFVETRETTDEDTKEITSNVETREHKLESPLFTEVCEATSSEKAELEDGKTHSETSNTKVVEHETVSKEENLEKKQDLMSDVQGGGDDVISSDNVSREDIKETTIGQCATTLADFEEGKDLSGTTTEILEEKESEEKSVDAEEANEPCENKVKDKSEQTPEVSADKPVKSCVEIAEENIAKDDANARNKEELQAKQYEESQGDRTEDRNEVKEDVVSTEQMLSKHGQLKEQNIGEIEACLTETVTEKTEVEIIKKEEDSSGNNIEDPNDNTTKEDKSPAEHEPTKEQDGGLDEVSKKNLTNLYETAAVEPHEDTTPSGSLGTSTEDASAKVESENFPTEDLESLSEVQIPQVVPKSADVKNEEECLTSEAASKEILSDENPEAYGERELTYESIPDEHIKETIQQADKSYTTEENVSQLEQIGDNVSPHEKRDMEQENQLNSTEDCDETVKDVILTEKISYTAPEHVINHDVAEARVDTLMGHGILQPTEDISCESTVNSESVGEVPQAETIPSLEEVKTIEPEVTFSNIEPTAYPSESEKLPTPALEPVCNVQETEVSCDSEEQKNNTNEILSLPEEENVKQVPNKSDEQKRDLNTEEKASTEESLELHEELEAVSESIIEEDKVDKIEPQPAQSDIASENIMNKEFKLENKTEEDLEDGKKDMEEDLILAPENQIKSIENQNKNVILSDEVTEKDNCPSEIDKKSTSNQKEFANEVKLSEPILTANTEVPTEEKAERKIEIESMQPAEDFSCVPKASSTIIGEVKDVNVDEASKNEIIPVPEIESTDTPLYEQDNMKLRESIPCNAQEIVDEKGVLTSQLTDKEILEAPDVEFEKKRRDEELISDVQPAEAIFTTEVKEEHSEATNDTCESPMGLELIEKKLVSMTPPEVLISPMVEDQANELVSETDKKKVEHSNISNTDQNPEFTKEEFTEGQTSIKESYIEEKGQVNFAVENKEEKNGNEVAEDVTVSEVLLEDETEKESKSIKDNINEEDIHKQLTSATDEICENERTISNHDELIEKKDSFKDTEDPKLMAESFNIKDEHFTVMNAPIEDSDLVSQEFESFENTGAEENMKKTDSNNEKETLGKPLAYDTALTTSNLISSSTEQDIEVRSGDNGGHGDVTKLEEKPSEVSDTVEIVCEDREAYAFLTENLQEASPDMILAEHDPEIITATETNDDKNGECPSAEKIGKLQVSTLNSEIDEGKQNVLGGMQNNITEVVQPQESSEDSTFISQNDNKNDDSLVLPSVEKDTKQVADLRFEEAPVIDLIKHEKDLDHTTEVKSVDAVSNAECSQIETPHIDTKEVTSELINQEIKKEADENMEISTQDVKSCTKVKSVDLEVPSVMDPNNKDEAYDAEKEVSNDNGHLESTGDRSKPIEEVSEMKQKEPTAKSLIYEVEDSKSSSRKPQCSSEVHKDDEKMSDEHEATKLNSQVPDKNIIGERGLVLTKDYEEDDNDNENEKTGDDPVMVEPSKDMEMKAVHKKSHNILSGVGSKVKHSIAKVKKAITGKSSHPKTPSP